MRVDKPDVRPFEWRATDADLADLVARLDAARLPESETVAGARRWEQGVPLTELTDAIEFWRTEYDWRALESRLDRVGQFRTTIEGVGIHFLHRRSPRSDAVPLIVTHGWPGSVVEFLDIIDELAVLPGDVVDGQSLDG
ncbi:epoxide hydrolase N-terminal domain-containing protein [Rhodococcus fascians]|nr:epoxide hydrolase N-terminal domain-containing protein [Rhodococcus fascians]